MREQRAAQHGRGRESSQPVSRATARGDADQREYGCAERQTHPSGGIGSAAENEGSPTSCSSGDHRSHKPCSDSSHTAACRAVDAVGKKCQLAVSPGTTCA